MRFSVNHPYPRHITVSFKNPITGMWLEDLHIFFDGRMSYRTSRTHFLEKVREYVRNSSQPAKAHHWSRIGESDYNEYPIPFVESTDFQWEINGATVRAYRGNSSQDRDTTYLSIPEGKAYEIRFHKLDRNRIGVSAFDVPMTGTAPHRAAYQEGWEITDTLKIIIKLLLDWILWT